MNKKICSKIVFIIVALAFAAAIAHAGQLKLDREYRYEVDSGYFEKMGSGRYIHVGYVLRKAGESGGALKHRFFDMEKREFTDISFPSAGFQEKFPELLGTTASPQFLAYNGRTSCLWMNELEGYRTKTWYYCQYDHETGKISDKIKMADVNDGVAIANMGIDPSGRYFYYSVNSYTGKDARKATAAMHLYRVNLEKAGVDWDMPVALQKRPLQLNVGYWCFNEDGTKLALLEYNDRAKEQDSHAVPQAMAYMVDIKSKTIDTYPIPLSPYGRVFTPEGKYMFIGSNEEGKIIRIDLEKKKADLSGPAMRRIFDLALSPNAKSLLIVADTTIVSPKVMEVRSTKDLSLLTSIPAKLLIPGDSGASPAPVLSFDKGRYIVYPYPLKNGKKGERALRVYEVPEILDSPKPAESSDTELKLSRGIVLAQEYADKHGIEIAGKEGVFSSDRTFHSMVITKDRIYFTGTTGSSDVYKPYVTKPVAVCLDKSGKLLWKTVLDKKGFMEHVGASLALDEKGNCVVFIISYYHSGNYGVGRFVKLNPAGKVLWQVQLRGKGNYNTPLADDKRILKNGNIAIKGRIDLNMNVKHCWTGEISKDGKVIKDITGERYE